MYGITYQLIVYMLVDSVNNYVQEQNRQVSS